MNWQIFDAAEFDRFHGQWDELNRRSSDSPVLHSSFVTYGLEFFAQKAMKLAIWGDLSKPDAMAIVSSSKFGVWDTFQPSQAPLGFWLNQSDVAVEKLLSLLAKSLPGIVLKVGITQQDPDIFPRPTDSGNIQTMDYIETARVDAGGECFDSYWQRRGKNLRQNMSKQNNRLTKADVTTKLVRVTDPDLVPSAIEAYGSMESSSWKATNGTAIHIDNSQGLFYTKLLKDFCARGEGVIYQYLFDDEIVASDICIRQSGVLVILKTTYNEEHRKASPAFLMRRSYFPELFEDPDVQKIEFYGKVMDWHRKWSEESRILYHSNYKKMAFL